MFADADCLLDCTVSVDVFLGGESSCNDARRFLLDASGPPRLEGIPPDSVHDCSEAIPAAVEPLLVDCDPDAAVVFREEREELDCAGNFDVLRTWIAEDRCGDRTVATRSLSFRDTTPPAITESEALVACLWPPNHRMVCFPADILSPEIVDDCSASIAWRVVSVVAGQPDDGLGDGSTAGDVRVADDGRSFCVRAERQGGEGEGRSYLVFVTATDDCGNESEPVRVGRVLVPHDRREHLDCGPAEERGPLR